MSMKRLASSRFEILPRRMRGPAQVRRIQSVTPRAYMAMTRSTAR